MLDVVAAFALMSVNAQTSKVPPPPREWGCAGTLNKELVIQDTTFTSHKYYDEIEATLALDPDIPNDCSYCLVATHYKNENDEYYTYSLINLNQARIVPKDFSQYGSPDAIFRKLKVIHDYYVRFEKLKSEQVAKKEDPAL